MCPGVCGGQFNKGEWLSGERREGKEERRGEKKKGESEDGCALGRYFGDRGGEPGALGRGVI